MPKDLEDFREEKILVIDRRSKTIGAKFYCKNNLSCKILNRLHHYLFRHIFNKGYNLAELGDLKNAEIEIKRALRLIKITKDFSDAEYLSKEVQKKFKINI